MEDVLFIEDGADRPFIIDRLPGIHGELRGRRRMMATKEVVAYRRKTAELRDQKQAAEAETLREQLIAKQLVSWSAPKAITPESIARLHPVIVSKLEAVILGVIADGTENLDGDKTDSELLGEVTGN